MHTKPTLTRAKKALVALTAALVAFLMVGLNAAHAEEFAPGYPKIGKSTEGAFGHKIDNGGYPLLTQMFSIQTSDNPKDRFQAYCIEMRVGMVFENPLKVGDWKDFPGDNNFKKDPKVRAKVAWIVQNSYPNVKDLAKLSNDSGAAAALTGNLTEKDAITGTQAAIWYLVDGLPFKGLRNGDGKHLDTTSPEYARVKALVDYLTGEKNVGLEPNAAPTIKINVPAGPVKAGDKVGPIRIESSQATAQLEKTDLPVVDASGKAVEFDKVPTGKDLFINIPKDAKAGSLKLSAKVSGNVYVGKLLISASDKRAQTIIIGDNHKADANATAEIKWEAAPVATPSPSPSPSTPAPSTPAPSTPAPSTPAPAPSTTAPAPAPSTSAPAPKPAPTPSAPKTRPGLPKTGA